MKFRTRLFLYYCIGVLSVTLVLAAYFIRLEEGQVRRATNERLLAQAGLIGENLVENGRLKNELELQRLIARVAVISRLRVTVVTPDGRVLGDSAQDYRRMPNHNDRPEIKIALQGKNGYAIHFSNTLGQNQVYVARPLYIQQRIVAVVRLSESEAELAALIFRLKALVLSGIGLTAILAVGCGWLITQQLVKPIHDLQNGVNRVGRGDLTIRLRTFGPDELGELGQAFDDMAQRLSASFQQLEAEKQKLEIIMENLADGIMLLDPNLKVLLANESICKLLELDRVHLMGRPAFEVILNHRLLDLIREASRSGRESESELIPSHLQQRHLLVLLTPLRTPESTVFSGTLMVLRDRTELRRLERVRQDFVANVSHELRTPITTIKAMSETLLGGAWQESEMLLRYLRATDQECDRLASLVDDLLILAKLDSKPEFRREPFDLVKLVREVKERFTPLQGKTPNFEIKLPEELPKVDGNRDQIKQVLINLLDNAFKYTPADGEIRISAWREGDFVKSVVADTGMGIPAAELSRIFERFYRVDKARSRELGGTGLGLSIVKHIVELHGGKVEVESSPGRGSVFSFTIPVATVGETNN
jgi:two-component system phosphate regulon sensor histidine kinase PhoR